jgi:Flp pilus assembly protein TadD
MDTGNLDATIAEYREAVRLKSDDAAAHQSLGIALWKKGNISGAIAEYRAAVRLKPNEADTHRSCTCHCSWFVCSIREFDNQEP